MTEPDPSPSPCIGLCELDGDTGLCMGCLRTLAEIASWNSYDAEGRAAVLSAIDRRRDDPDLRSHFDRWESAAHRPRLLPRRAGDNVSIEAPHAADEDDVFDPDAEDPRSAD